MSIDRDKPTPATPPNLTHEEFERQASMLGRAHRNAARDYFSAVTSAGLSPLPVTAANIAAGHSTLVESGCSSAWPRQLAWVVALRKFPLDYQAAIGADKIPAARRGSAPSISPEPGFFAVLEADIDNLKATAIRPRSDDCDEHDPKSEAVFVTARKRALIVANRLYKIEYLDEAVSLHKLISVDAQIVYVKLAYGILPKTDGNVVRQNSRPAQPTLQFRIFDDMTAVTMLATARFGKDSEEAKLARDTTSEHKHPQISERAVVTITTLAQPTQFRIIHGLASEWIARAEQETDKRVRIPLADLAAAMAIEVCMLPRPGDLAKMKIDGSGAPVICKRHASLEGELIVPDAAREIILRRNTIRGISPGEESWLFPGNPGRHQLERSVSSAFSRATRRAGLQGLTLQRMRDVCAKVMMNDDPGRFRLIAAILGYSEVGTASRRFAAFSQSSRKAD